jgi:hypothetical protein
MRSGDELVNSHVNGAAFVVGSQPPLFRDNHIEELTIGGIT